jgi:type IX secretion system PorP/SprF family membrane protein
LAWNPASAGAAETKQLTGMYRKQWIGFNGAPSMQTFSYDQETFQQRVGLGANLTHFEMGITRVVSADLIYAYKIETKKGAFRIGAAPNIRYFYQNWLDRDLVGDAPLQNDNAVPNQNSGKLLVNVGAGFYYHDAKYYFGAAVNKLVKNNIDFRDEDSVISREERHFNFMAGADYALNDELQFTPNVLIKYVYGAPFDADINLGLKLQKKYYSGLTYRAGGGQTSKFGESIDVILGLQATEKVFVALSYDIGISALRKQHHGSLELMARYQFEPPANDGPVISPNNPFANSVKSDKEKAKDKKRMEKQKAKEQKRLEKEIKRMEKESEKPTEKTASEGSDEKG